jgi:hypothetical protein
MKDQYFGDINDYRKYGLLRLLTRRGVVKTGVCWMLTSPDGRPDGRKTGYLQRAAHFRHLDPDVFDFLRRSIVGRETDEHWRKVHLVEGGRILPNATYFSDPLDDDLVGRQAYFERVLRQFRESQVSLVFFDPDNGFSDLGGSGRDNRRRLRSNKYLRWDELQRTFAEGFSVLTYQHFVREQRAHFVDRLAGEIKTRTRSSHAFSFWTPHAVFLLVPHEQHLAHFQGSARSVALSPWGLVGSCRTCAGTGKPQIYVQEH